MRGLWQAQGAPAMHGGNAEGRTSLAGSAEWVLFQVRGCLQSDEVG